MPIPWDKDDQDKILDAQNTVISLNQRITELSAHRDQLTNFSDGVISSAKVQANKIIQDALAQASATVIDANKQKQAADDYLTSKQSEGDSIITNAQTITATITQDKAQFEEDKQAFEDYKTAQQEALNQTAALNDQRTKDLNEEKSNLDSLSDLLEDKRKALDNRKSDLDALSLAVTQAQADLIAKQDVFNQQVIQLQKDKDSVAQQQEALYVSQKYLGDARVKLDALVKSNSDLQASLNTRSIDLDSQQASINTQLANLSTQKAAQD